MTTTDLVERVLRAVDGDQDQAATALRTAERIDLTVLLPGDEHWPVGLDALGGDAPVALWVSGHAELLRGPMSRRIAITGARACTAYGEHVTGEIATALTPEHTIITGGGYGIDIAAHRAHLAAGAPGIAVMAGGVDRLYPVGNTQTLQRVASTGLLLSEQPPGTPPSRARFVQRTRLIAALAGATLIVEAGYRSGALTVAHRALALGRAVAAVPGPITSAASAGCHRLMQDGEAHLITSAADLTALTI